MKQIDRLVYFFSFFPFLFSPFPPFFPASRKRRQAFANELCRRPSPTARQLVHDHLLEQPPSTDEGPAAALGPATAAVSNCADEEDDAEAAGTSPPSSLSSSHGWLFNGPSPSVTSSEHVPPPCNAAALVAGGLRFGWHATALRVLAPACVRLLEGVLAGKLV